MIRNDFEMHMNGTGVICTANKVDQSDCNCTYWNFGRYFSRKTTILTIFWPKIPVLCVLSSNICWIYILKLVFV